MTTLAIWSADAGWRERIAQALTGEPGICVAGSAADASALERLLHQRPLAAVLADAPVSSRLADLTTRHPGVAFLIFTSVENEDEAVEAVLAGARAVLPHAAGTAAVRAALLSVSNGLAVVPHGVMNALIEASAPNATPPVMSGTAAGAAVILTPREREVLAALADGASNKTIARRLGISYHTVKFHVAAILSKLDADSRTEAVANAVHLGLVML